MSEENLDNNCHDRIAEWCTNKTILITGGSGFVGKVLIEKLLRSCPDLKKIYVLIRTKKNKDPNERLKDMFTNPLFDKLKQQTEGGQQSLMRKIEAVAGDVSDANLGLTPDSRARLVNECNIIYHCAATIRFDETLKKAVLLNVRGTKLMLEMAKECKHLEVFSYLSTAYCHLNERILYEKPYPPPADPYNVIKTVEWMDEKIIDSITDKILGDIPNTYAFTKALAESLVIDEFDKLPGIILRPSIIIPIWKEPIPGWTDNINGPTGLLIGAGKGVIRTMYCKGESYADYVPVDITVNAIVAASYDYVNLKKRRIFNLTSSAEYKVSWEEIIDIGREVINKEMPLNGVVWYPGGSMKKSKILHYICVLLFHLIPAVILDALLILLGYKPVLIRVHKRILKGFEVFEYYANRQWDFNNDDAMIARENLNPKERQIWKLYGDGINYYDYFKDCTHAARLYILKEGDESLPAARRHMRVMWWVDKICKILLTIGFMYFIVKNIFMPILSS